MQPPSRPIRTAAILVIGDEILSGKVEDRNVAPAARLLRAHGILLRRVLVVADEVDEIARSVAELSKTHDVLLTSGGVGPTHDDKTIEGVARAFDVGLVLHEGLKAVLEEHYGERCGEVHLRMAQVPEGACLEHGASATWPALRMHNTWVLPGVPLAFARKLAILDQVLERDPPFLTTAVFVSLEEPDIKNVLDVIVAGYPSVHIGSYPDWESVDYKTKVTFDGLVHDSVTHARDAFIEAFANHVTRVD